MGLILVHELGHFLTAEVLGLKTDKIYLYPYGGISVFNTKINTPRKEEWLVLIMGPLFQFVFYFLCSLLLKSPYLNRIFFNYHFFLLFFNLLPIYPLDGGKILLLILSYFKSYKKSFYYCIYISYTFLCLFFICFLVSNYLFLLAVVFLIFSKTKKEKQEFPYIFEKFLIERVLYIFSFKKRKIIENVDDMMLDTFHYFKTSNGIVNEKDCLLRRSKRF